MLVLLPGPVEAVLPDLRRTLLPQPDVGGGVGSRDETGAGQRLLRSLLRCAPSPEGRLSPVPLDGESGKSQAAFWNNSSLVLCGML